MFKTEIFDFMALYVVIVASSFSIPFFCFFRWKTAFQRTTPTPTSWSLGIVYTAHMNRIKATNVCIYALHESANNATGIINLSYALGSRINCSGSRSIAGAIDCLGNTQFGGTPPNNQSKRAHIDLELNLLILF